MAHLTVGKKFALGCTALVVISIIISTVSVLNITRINGNLQAISGDSLPGVYRIGAMNGALLDLRGNYWKYMMNSGNPEKEAQIANAIAADKQSFMEEYAAYEPTITTADDRELFSKIKPTYDQFSTAWDGVEPLAREGKGPEAVAKYYAELEPAYEATKASVKAEVDFNKNNGDHNATLAQQAVSSAHFWAWLLLATSVLVGAVLAYFITKSVNQALNHIIAELSEGAEQVASAAGQVAAASQSLAQGSSEQAASLEETSASSEEINSMARKNTDNSRSAAELVSSSQRKFVDTNEALEQTVVAMGEINAQSGKISKIIKTIDEIAFQTNILALNAAVEAARAGEAGMGFAVVADEVRNLAQRAAQAAKDTSSLIEESISKSNDGKTKVDQVASAIQSLTEEAATIKTLVDEVNLGSQEQARGIEQIVKAITQMEQVTQKTAANAEESASAAEELTAQSETVKDVVGRLTAMVSDQPAIGSVHPRRTASSPVRNQNKPWSLPRPGSALGLNKHEPAASKTENAFPLEAEFQEF